jgi:hypothetical protein
VNGEPPGDAWVAIQGSNTFNAASVWRAGIWTAGTRA